MSVSAASSKQTWWQRQPAKRKQMLILGGAVGGFLLLMMPFLSSGPGVKVQSRESRKVSDILPVGESRDIGLTGLANDVDSLRKQLEARDNEIAALRQAQSVAPKESDPQAQQGIDALNARLRLLEEQGRERDATAGNAGRIPSPPSAARPAVSPPTEPGGSTRPGQGPRGQQAPQQELVRVPQMRTIAGEAPMASVDEPVEAEQPSAYLPSGTILTGVTLTGLDAPTGRGARQDPVPVLVRVKADAILPNRFRADVKECFAVLAGTGDLSSERAHLRGETFSCVHQDGTVVDIALNVIAIGEDGKAGLRGRLVSKQGQAIGKALLAGIAQGTAQAFNNGGSYGGYGQGSVDLSRAAESGAYGGAGSALDRVAQFYIDLAEQLFPVIEISAGRPVSLVLLKGTQIKLVSAS